MTALIRYSILIAMLTAAAVAQTTPAPTPAPMAPAQAPAAPTATPAPPAAPQAAPAPSPRAEARSQAAAERARVAAERAQARSRARAVVVSPFGSGSYLGVDIQDVSAERAKALKLTEERGAEITLVDQDGPAGKGGLKEHDVVLSFNGQRVEGAEQFRRMIHETPPGRKVALGVSREGKPLTLSAELADRTKLGGHYATASRLFIPPIPPIDVQIPPMAIEPNVRVFTMSTARTGLAVESLTPQLGEFFGAPNGRGLLVRSVEKGSAAEQAGIKAGDVIVKVGNERIEDTGDWRMALRDQSGSVSVTVIRDKREQTLTLKMPERRGSADFHLAPDADVFAFDLRDFASDLALDADAMKEAQKEWKEQMKESQDAWKVQMKQWGEKWKEQSKDKFFLYFDDDSQPRLKKPAPLKDKEQIKSKVKIKNVA